MAKMLGVWMNINNPNRSRTEELNLTVGGTIVLDPGDLQRLPSDGLFAVGIKVMDEDTFSDDVVHTDNSFFLGVHDTEPRPFTVQVFVPAAELRGSEPSWEDTAEIYCRVAAQAGAVATNARNSQTEDVAI